MSMNDDGGHWAAASPETLASYPFAQVPCILRLRSLVVAIVSTVSYTPRALLESSTAFCHIGLTPMSCRRKVLLS
jgi:hypothetical protein